MSRAPNLPFYGAARNAAPHERPQGANTGLWFSRFFNAYDAEFKIPDDGKGEWLKDIASKTAGDGDQLHMAADRLRHLVAALGGECLLLQTDAPLATGLGLSHPVENGFTFHPTYGVPFLCGASVKGMLRGWVSLWMEFADESDRAATLLRWFGNCADGSSSDLGSSGTLVFMDALPISPVRLVVDVLTPHMGSWYESGGRMRDQDSDARALPADWHNPVPVPFLAVDCDASFLFSVAPRIPTDVVAAADVKCAVSELTKALDWIGIGAKTATGYGRLVDRVRLGEERKQERLRQAGISIGEETWESAALHWDKGKSVLTISNPLTKKDCKGKLEHFRVLPQDTQKRLEKSKPVLVKAVVRIQGNLVELVRIDVPN